MAFFSKAGNILRQAVSKHGNSEIFGSNPSVFRMIRCMSSSKVFVGGLSYGTDETSLMEAFNKYGEVVEARVIMDRDSGRSRGFGFVTYNSGEEASAAIQALDGQELHGRRIRVNYATDRAQGGGFGGGGYAGGYGGGGYAGGYGGGGGNFGGGGGYGNADNYGGGGSYGNYGGGGGGGYGGNNYGGGSSFGGGSYNQGGTYGSGANYDSGSQSFGVAGGGGGGGSEDFVSGDAGMNNSFGNGGSTGFDFGSDQLGSQDSGNSADSGDVGYSAEGKLQG